MPKVVEVDRGDVGAVADLLEVGRVEGVGVDKASGAGSEHEALVPPPNELFAEYDAPRYDNPTSWSTLSKPLTAIPNALILLALRSSHPRQPSFPDLQEGSVGASSDYGLRQLNPTSSTCRVRRSDAKEVLEGLWQAVAF